MNNNLFPLEKVQDYIQYRNGDGNASDVLAILVGEATFYDGKHFVVVSVKSIAEELSVSPYTARKAICSLQSLGILVKVLKTSSGANLYDVLPKHDIMAELAKKAWSSVREEQKAVDLYITGGMPDEFLEAEAVPGSYDIEKTEAEVVQERFKDARRRTADCTISG